MPGAAPETPGSVNIWGRFPTFHLCPAAKWTQPQTVTSHLVAVMPDIGAELLSPFFFN